MYLPSNTLLQGGKYRIQRFISCGGFGCTYEAINTTSQQRVAIKELFVKDVSDRDEHTLTISAYSTNKSVLLNKIKKKFLEEANALKAMSHPNIVRVHESFEENGTAYYVMDYIDGQSLHDIIKQNGALSESRSLKYINQVADALAYVHARNRLHLDIKPGNIMIDSHDKVVLIDFGVSKQYDEANGENTSTLIGKSPGYSPVEQLGNNVQQFSPATDIYALGATLYKCVTGNTPPDATTVLSDGIPELPHSISNSIRETIKKSMYPIKGNRPQSIKAFLNISTSEKTTNTQLWWKEEGLVPVSTWNFFGKDVTIGRRFVLYIFIIALAFDIGGFMGIGVSSLWEAPQLEGLDTLILIIIFSLSVLYLFRHLSTPNYLVKRRKELSQKDFIEVYNTRSVKYAIVSRGNADNHKYGLYDVKKLRLHIPFKYDKMQWDESRKTLRVEENGQSFIIDTKDQRFN